MIACSSSPCSYARSRAEAFPRPRANSASPSLRSPARLRRSSAGWGSSSSSAPPGRFPPPTPARRCSLAPATPCSRSMRRRARRAAPTVSPALLRVALPPEYGVRRIVPLLPAFFVRHPLLKIDLMMSDRYENLIAEGADLALRIGDLPDSSFVARKLESARRLFIAAPSYLASSRRARKPCRSRWPRRHQRPGRHRRRDLGRAPQRTDRAPDVKPAHPFALGDRRRRLRRRRTGNRDRVELDVRGSARFGRGGRDPHRLCARSGHGLCRLSRRPEAVAKSARLQRLSGAGSGAEDGREGRVGPAWEQRPDPADRCPLIRCGRRRRSR